MGKCKYYDNNDLIIEEAFTKEINKINDTIDKGLNVNGLKKVRRKLYYLKSRYEESGSRNLEIELLIECVNEFLRN